MANEEGNASGARALIALLIAVLAGVGALVFVYQLIQGYQQRIQEADRLGFKEIFFSKYNTKGIDASRYKIRLRTIGKIEELYKAVFE